MLLAGARTDIRDKEGRKPIEYVEDVGIYDLRDELRRMLVSTYFCAILI